VTTAPTIRLARPDDREATRTQGKTSTQAAAMVGWSRTTFYRHG